MPTSVTSSYPTATLSSAQHSRKPSLAIPTANSHASALPLYGEYVVDSPLVAATGVPAPSSEQEDYVFCDPVAFRYLEDDPCVSAIHRQQQLSGYEVYLVEQWACSRVHPTFVICTYTGDQAHKVSVSVLRIPRNQALWSRKLSVYFEAANMCNARPKKTDLGIVMLTNLSSFPPALSVVHVPGGDVKSHRMGFIVNEDLKRMGCSGRSALTLDKPTDASQTKFHQLFRTCDRNPFETAVTELVRLCQLALMAFEKLKRTPMYADGLLCDITEKGIRDWWAELGTEFYNVEPNDGTFGPTTVAGLLGMLLGIRNRLNLCGAPAPKDVFDLQQLEKAVMYFQRQQRMVRTGRLDRETIERLQKATAKSGGPDIFAVPRAIKSTVADLSARAVGSSGPTDVSAVETVDIDRFVRHLTGESCKFLWYGKPRKVGSVPVGTIPSNGPSRRTSFERQGGSMSGDDEAPSISWPIDSTEAQPASGLSASSAYHNFHHPGLSTVNTFASTEFGREATVSDLRKAVFKSMAGRVKDVASNISAGADYVRGRGHQRSQTKDFFADDELSMPVSPVVHQSRFTTPPGGNSNTGSTKTDVKAGTPDGNTPIDRATTGSPSPSLNNNMGGSWNDKFPSQAPDTSAGTSVHEHVPDSRCSEANEPRSRRRKSFDNLRRHRHHEAFFPNRLSFSLAEDAVLTWNLPFAPPDRYVLTDRVQGDCEDVMRWSDAHLSALHGSLSTIDSNMVRLNSVYEKKCADVGIAEREGRLGMETEREKIRDAIREAEVLGARMQYEVGVVQGKLVDLEESVANLTKFVHELEAEAKILGDDEDEKKKRRWFAWLLGT
ncbi:hypothetical protein FN846DRAFT_1002813 [Sphaerosporella brunnea]|uniref:STB6-like N-terminal domain-containing protein n=1 Tax=Sphaerosporella brunnea TaxID=1250544 RepID=A0A5J5EFV0_9PEZI|nr:hypothetical protein FN846DRAFT_1002813 [Sphaerosporella brunnea]